MRGFPLCVLEEQVPPRTLESVIVDSCNDGKDTIKNEQLST